MARVQTVLTAVLTFALLTANIAAAQVKAEDAQPATGAVSPINSRDPRTIRASLVLPEARSLPPLEAVRQTVSDRRRDSVWNGTLIGAGIGAGGGYLWARNICGSNDGECFAIAGTIGILGGTGIGAAIGAVADALHK